MANWTPDHIASEWEKHLHLSAAHRLIDSHPELAQVLYEQSPEGEELLKQHNADSWDRLQKKIAQFKKLPRGVQKDDSHSVYAATQKKDRGFANDEDSKTKLRELFSRK